MIDMFQGSFLNDVKAVFQLTMPLLVVEDASLTLTIFELYLKLVFVATLSQSPYQQDTVDLMKVKAAVYLLLWSNNYSHPPGMLAFTGYAFYLFLCAL